MDHVETIDGIPVIVGTDLDDGGTIIVGRTADLTSEPLSFDFAMLDPGITICDFFVFDRTGAHSVAGADILTNVSGGRCSEFLTGRMNPMTGTRTATPAAEPVASKASMHSATVIANREALVATEDLEGASVAAHLGDASSVADRLMRSLERRER
jgi:hypothetical protein